MDYMSLYILSGCYWGNRPVCERKTGKKQISERHLKQSFLIAEIYTVNGEISSDCVLLPENRKNFKKATFRVSY